MKPKFKKGDKIRFKGENNYTYIVKNFIIKSNDIIFYELNNLPVTVSENLLELAQEEKVTRKIIGYKVPFDMYVGEWKQGDIARIASSGNLSDFYCIINKPGSIPIEIAETWEPVYEEAEKPKTIFERVNSFEDACKELKLDFKDLDSYYNTFDILRTICEALNEGWIQDFNDFHEEKWVCSWDNEEKKLYVHPSNVHIFYPKSLYLKWEDLAYHLIKIAEKELLEYFEV